VARFSDPNAETVVRDDLIAAIAQYKDQQFIDPAITASTGIRPASITNGVTPITVTPPTSVWSVTNAVRQAIANMLAAGIVLRSPISIMDAGTYLTLWTLRTSQDVFAFRDEMAQGKFMGIPYIYSTGSPVATVPNPDEGQLILVEQSEVFLAEDPSVSVDVSREASIAMDSAAPTALTSLWQNNLVGLRAEQGAYWLKRRAAAVQLITGIDITGDVGNSPGA